MDTNFNFSDGPEPRRIISKKFLIAAAVILVLVLGVGAAYGFTALDWFKNPRQIYLQTEAKSFKQLMAGFEKGYDEYYTANIQSILDKSVHSQQEISLNLSGNLPNDPQLAPIVQLLKQSKLLLDTYNDSKGLQSYTKVDLAFGGTSLVGAEFFTDKDKLGLAVPAIYKKYGIAYLKDSDKFKSRFGMELPKRFIAPEEYLNAVKIPKQEYEPVLNTYAKLYADSIKDSQVTLAKGTFTEDGANIPVQQITVSFTAEEAKALSLKLADQIEKDDKLADLIFKRYDNLQKLYSESGAELAKQLGAMNKSDIQTQLKQFSQELRDGANSAKGLKMVLYVNKNGSILDRQITPEGEPSSLVRIASWTGGDNKESRLLQLKTAEGEFKLSSTVKPEGNTKKGTFDVSYKENQATPLNLTGEFTLGKDGPKQNNQVTFNLSTQEGNQPVKISGDVKSHWTTNDKSNSKEGDTTIKLTVDAPEAKGINLEINVNSKLEYGASVSLPKIDSSNSVDLANMSDQEMAALQQEIGLGLQTFIMNNQVLFAGLFGGTL